MVSSVLPPLCPKKLEEDKLVLCNASESSGKDESKYPILCQQKQDNKDNGKKIPILWKSRIPSKKRTPKVQLTIIFQCLGSFADYVAELWSVLEGTCLGRTRDFGIVELRISSKFVVRNLTKGQQEYQHMGYMLV
ncbi:hypothetical protein P8452_35872 [Trifolium repens]|nr:hypothetical protein P8452_35872 [Trifolium repens]